MFGKGFIHLPTCCDMTVTDSGARRRVGVFGGTFDPPHNAHLVAAASARDALGLEHVYLVVAGDPWQKTAAVPVTPAHHRLAMTQLLVEGVEGLSVSDLEIRRSGPSFTVDTLGELASPDITLVLILGSDALAGIGTWKRPHQVVEMADIAVVRRHGLDGPVDSPVDGPIDSPIDSPAVDDLAEVVAMMPPGRHLEQFEIPRMDISSSEIRRRMRNGLGVDGLLPARVASYAAHHGIYRDQP